ncbi:unnamed protein product, partial [marine sediment metagenome]
MNCFFICHFRNSFLSIPFQIASFPVSFSYSSISGVFLSSLPSYQILETLGDAVIKLIFSLKLYSKGEIDPGNLTKTKLRLEDNKTFHKIAMGMELWKYIFSSKKQRVKDSLILADVFEAICGAIFIDSGNNLEVVEKIIIDRFITDWESLIKESPHLYKNQLLEYLQNKFKVTPT